MTDYTGNSKKSKEQTPKPEKNIEKVVTGEVVVAKKSLGRKVKDLFIHADFRSVVRYVISDVFIPAATNLIVESSTKGIERMFYGERGSRARSLGGQRITYNSPGVLSRPGIRDQYRSIPQQSQLSARAPRAEYILTSKGEAELVLERMGDILNAYEIVSVADLHSLVGLETSYVDQKWGWDFLGDARIIQVREGWLLDFPQPQPIQ